MKTLIVILLSLITFSIDGIRVTKKCQTSDFSKINVKSLDSLLIGTWRYNYSFVNDTCFHIPILGDLPQMLSFEKGDEGLLKKEYPRLYEFGKNKLLNDLISSHDAKPFGSESYPLVNGISTDSSVIKITHYLKENGLAKGYSYYIEGMDTSALVVKNERTYTINGVKKNGVKHVYTRE